MSGFDDAIVASSGRNSGARRKHLRLIQISHAASLQCLPRAVSMETGASIGWNQCGKPGNAGSERFQAVATTSLISATLTNVRSGCEFPDRSPKRWSQGVTRRPTRRSEARRWPSCQRIEVFEYLFVSLHGLVFDILVGGSPYAARIFAMKRSSSSRSRVLSLDRVLRRIQHLLGSRAGFGGAAVDLHDVGGGFLGALGDVLNAARDFLRRRALLLDRAGDRRGDARDLRRWCRRSP